MPRSLRQYLDSRRTLPPTIVLLVLLSVLPLRWLGWLDSIGILVRTLEAPITNSAAAVSVAVRPPTVGGPSSALTDQLKADNAKALFMLTQEQLENQRLRALIEDLQSGVELAPDLSLRLLASSVIGRDADLARQVLHLRAGSAQGVVPGSVAVVDGAQLLGRVQSVGPKVSTVILFTDRAAGRVQGRVMVDERSLDGGVECDLEPVGGGILRGRLAEPEVRAGEQPPEVRPGMLVRVHDATWPRNAQMLELGTIESIEPNPDQPIRRIITVRPRLDLARVSEVLLRIATESEGGGGPP
jgi:hypothetical protein